MKNIFSKWKGKADDDFQRRGTSVKAIDHSAANISLAAQMLYDCIHSTLSNGAALRGDDLSGFTSFLDSLNSKPPDDLNQWRYAQDTTGFVDVLLSYKDHPEFIEICNQRNLGEALINALRLLRMLEIKRVGIISSASVEMADSDWKSDKLPIGTSFEASRNLCEIFGVMCTSIQTVEAMRPVLTKLFCLTLQGYPESGIHLQRHVADVIGTLCKLALSSQIVWFLHDSQAIKFMVRSLSELVSIDNTQSVSQSKSTTLKGFAAEEKEIWLVAFESFANLLATSYQYSSVLLGDLEAADGIPILVNIVVHSRQDRCMKIVTLLFELLIGEIDTKEGAGGGAKSAELSKIAPIFTGVLQAVLDINKIIQGDETVEALIEISSGLVGKSGEAWKDIEGESILQSLAFGFLTLCSSHIDTYVMLEQSHHIFAAIVLCIPSFCHFESLVAVTKTLVFVGGEGRPSFEILSFCAATSVMLHNTLFMADNKNQIQSQENFELLSYILSAFDEVLNGDRKHSLIFSCCGLKYMFFDSLKGVLTADELDDDDVAPSSLGDRIMPHMPLFRQLLQLVRTALKQNAFSVISDLRNSGILELFVEVICSLRYRSDEVLEFFDIHIVVLLSEQDVELDYVLINVCDMLLRLLQTHSFDRIAHALSRLLDAFTAVSATSHSFAVHRNWQTARGFECLMSILAALDGVFPSMPFDEGDTQETVSSDRFDPAALKLRVNCLRRVFSLCSVFLTNSKEGYMFSYQNKSSRIYFKDKIGYGNVAKSLKNSGVLSSPFVEDVLNDAISLSAGKVDNNTHSSTSHISNPEGMVTVIDLLPHLRTDLAKVAIDLIEQTASLQIDGYQVLVEAGITKHILNNFSSILGDSMNPLKEPLSQLLLKLCSEHLILGDFASILRNLVRSELVVSANDRMLLPPWQCFDTSGVLQDRSWFSVQLLNTLLKRTIRQQGTSFISVGPGASYKAGRDSFLSALWSDTAMGKPFPTYGLTASTWFQIEENAAMKQRFADGSSSNSPSPNGSLIPLLALVSSAIGMFLEVQVDVHLSSGRVIYRKYKGVGVSQFKVPYISEGDWHLFNVTLKRPKRLMTTKTSVVVLLDGQVILNDSVELETPSNGSVEIMIGKRVYGAVEDLEEGNGKSWDVTAGNVDPTVLHDFLQVVESTQLPVALWRMGTFCLFEESLNQNQLSRILSKGPSYHGNFQGESPLVDLLPTFVTTTLCKCNSSLYDLGKQLDNMSLRAVESVVVPTLDPDDNNKMGGVHVEMPSIPAPILIYSGVSFEKNHSLSVISPSTSVGSGGGIRGTLSPPPTPNVKAAQQMNRKRASPGSIDGKRDVESYNAGFPRLALNNLAADTTWLPQAELCNGYHASRVESMSRCVAAIGGPAALMPFVQAASTESQLLMALYLVRNSTRNDPVNMKYMHTGGYQLLSFLLTLKPKCIITEAVVESLFLFAIDKGSHLQPEKMSRANDFRSLLVDTQALYHLILNHQVWGADRYNAAYVVVDLLRGLVSEDAHHAALNSKRLSLLGVGRWLLFLMVYGANKAVNKQTIKSGDRSQSQTSPPDRTSTINTAEGEVFSLPAKPLEDNEIVWRISCRSVGEMAIRRDASDPFFVLCLAVVRPIMMCRLRGKDIELLGQMVTNSLYSVDDVNTVTEKSANNTDIDSRDHRMFASTNIHAGSTATKLVDKSVDDSVDYLFPPSTRQISTLPSCSDRVHDGDTFRKSVADELSPTAMMRVALIRFLRELYICKIEHVPETMLNGVSTQISTFAETAEVKALEDTGVKQMFGKTLNSIWFLSAFLKSSDFAATAEILRLLVLQMQHDPGFSRSFCAADGMHVLQRQLLDEPMHLAVVLPIVGMFFNVPISKLPLPVFQCDSSLIQLLGATEGPSVCAPEVSEIFTPAFDILIGQFSAHARQKTAVGYMMDGNPNDLIRAVMSHAMSNCPLLREFMQFRIVINTTVLGLLRCSDAMEDFGTRVYVSDLLSSVNDDYLDGSTCQLRGRDRIDDTAEEDNEKKPLFLDVVDKIDLILPEGSCLLNIIRGIISDGVKFYQNPQVIAFLLLAFPPLLSELNVLELHKLIIAQLAVVTKSMYVEVNLDYIAVIVKIFSFIVPIAKARLLGDDVLFEILQLIIVLLDMLCFMEKNFVDDHEKYMTLRREFVAIARYFSVLSISAMRSMETNSANNSTKSSVLQLVRSHLQLLFSSADDEPPLPARAKNTSQDTVLKGTSVLDSFQLSIMGSEQANKSLLASARSKRIALFNTTLSLVQTEINKISSAFTAYLFALLHPLFLDDNNNIRVESMRIIAGLIHYRHAVVSNILSGPCSETSPDVVASDIAAIDGYMKLLPDNTKVLQAFLKLFSGGSASQLREMDDNEDSRFADFMYWLTSSTSYRHDVVLQYLENCLGGTLPSLTSVADVLKLIQGSRVLTEMTDVTSLSESANSMLFAAPAMQSIKYMSSEMVHWTLCGIADSASGAKLWNIYWMALQCSPIWGALPLSSTDNIAPPESRRIGWRLGYLEGPEKIRARMEEDFGTSLSDGYSFPVLDDTVLKSISVGVAVVAESDRDISNQKYGDDIHAENASEASPILLNADTAEDLSIEQPVENTTGFTDLLKQIQKSGGLRKHNSTRQINDFEDDSAGNISSVLSLHSAVDVDDVNADDFFADENSMNVEYTTNTGDLSLPLSPVALNNVEDSDFQTPLKESPRMTPRYSFGGEEEDHSTPYERYFDTSDRNIAGVSAIVGEVKDADFENTEQPNGDQDYRDDISDLADPVESNEDIRSSIGGTLTGSERLDRFKDGFVKKMSSFVDRDLKGETTPTSSFKELNRRLSKRFSNSTLAGVLGPPDSNNMTTTPTKRESITLMRRQSGADLPENATNGGNALLPGLSLGSSSNGSAIKNPYEMDESSRKFHLLNEIMKGLIGSHEWITGQTLNVDRIFGLESHPAVLVLTPKYVHLLDGFQLIQSTESNDKLIEWTSLTGRINVTTSFSALMMNNPGKVTTEDDNYEKKSLWQSGGLEEVAWLRQIWKQFLRDDIGYFRIPIDEIYTVFRRRYQLQDKALEITSSKGFSLLFACKSRHECDGLLKKLLETDMINSIFRIAGLNNIQLGVGLFPYRKVIAYYISYVQKLWLKGSMSNFEYLMHLNTAAGRSFQDITQYPVFPWILSDYTSAELDLNNSRSFRDLTKPMGALGAKRAQQYKERFRTMQELLLDEQEEMTGRGQDQVDGVTSTPPFFYGTHYSCAGYVLHYLMRMQPFSGMAINLQGGQFDKPDRLFRSIGQSWLSASQDNLQDVRELIPEFFFLPDFLQNCNKFSLGCTQRGEKIDDVILPPWANNSPAEFIRKHREALECRYVSENLHHWIDLIFGYKQLGKEAETAMNVFIHLTYEGEVDVDTIQDPIIREATIAQINNFGQTPTKLFQKPHPKKTIPPIWKPNPQVEGQLIIDSDAVNYLLAMSPPFSVVGAAHLTDISKVFFGQATFPPHMSSKSVGNIGDLRVIGRDKIVAVPSGCILMPSKFGKYVRYWRPSGSISMHPIQPPIRMDFDRDVETHDSLHSRPVSCVIVSSDGALIATGSEDRSVRLWALPKLGSNSRRLHHLTTFAGHSGSIICLDISIKLSIVVSGSADKTAMIWDIHHMKLLHVLGSFLGPVISVSINQLTGNVAVLSSDKLSLFDINGHLITFMLFAETLLSGIPLSHASTTTGAQIYPSFMTATKAKPRVVAAPSCADWQDGVVAITGHEGGYLFLWKIITEGIGSSRRGGAKVLRKGGKLRRILVPFGTLRTHKADISVIRLCHWNVPKLRPLITRQFEGENGLEMLVGDVDGYVSRWDAARIDEMSSTEITTLTARHQSTVALFSSAMLVPEITSADDSEIDVLAETGGSVIDAEETSDAA